MKAGKVYIIGAGPGDYKLITIKAYEYIKNADVIVLDRLIDKRILNFTKNDVEIVDVGKFPYINSILQDEINKVIVNYAMQGKNVARIKGGDPFLFGRGGEECVYLSENNIDYVVVPGITSAISVPLYAGIPVTHRKVAASLHIITGNETDEKEDSMVNYEALAKNDGTLVFLMCVKNLNKICENLIKHGKSLYTPVAIIENGVKSNQRAIFGNLENIVELARNELIKAPAIIVIGDVVNLAEKIKWVDKLPLSGNRIVITRPPGQNDSLANTLEQLGAEVIKFPVIKISKLENMEKVNEIITNIKEFNWIVFTSINGVKAFLAEMSKRKLDIRGLYGIKIATVGTATAKKLIEVGIIPDFIPDEFTVSKLKDGLKELAKSGDKILLLRSDIVKDDFSGDFEKSNIFVTELPIYKTEVNQIDNTDLFNSIKNEEIDFITFTSPSTVKAFVSIMGEWVINKSDKIKFIAIGPVTKREMKEVGFDVTATADIHTQDGIVRKIEELSKSYGVHEHT